MPSKPPVSAKENVTLRLDGVLARRLRVYAATTDKSLSEVVTAAAINFLEAQRAKGWIYDGTPATAPSPLLDAMARGLAEPDVPALRELAERSEANLREAGAMDRELSKMPEVARKAEAAVRDALDAQEAAVPPLRKKGSGKPKR